MDYTQWAVETLNMASIGNTDDVFSEEKKSISRLIGIILLIIRNNLNHDHFKGATSENWPPDIGPK